MYWKRTEYLQNILCTEHGGDPSKYSIYQKFRLNKHSTYVLWSRSLSCTNPYLSRRAEKTISCGLCMFKPQKNFFEFFVRHCLHLLRCEQSILDGTFKRFFVFCNLQERRLTDTKLLCHLRLGQDASMELLENLKLRFKQHCLMQPFLRAFHRSARSLIRRPETHTAASQLLQHTRPDLATGLDCPDYGIGYEKFFHGCEATLAVASKKTPVQGLAFVPFNCR